MKRSGRGVRSKGGRRGQMRRDGEEEGTRRSKGKKGGRERTEEGGVRRRREVFCSNLRNCELPPPPGKDKSPQLSWCSGSGYTSPSLSD